MTGTWISAALELPKAGRRVLAVKELEDGTREICMAYCYPDCTFISSETGEPVKGPHWFCEGNNNIIYWMPLPKIPSRKK